MHNDKMKIVVVGGGSAGWITLSYLAATVNAELIIVHSNEVDPIGVGESTTPTIKHVADTIGVDEKTWMKDSKATFKYGVEIFDFNRIGSRWFHTFDDMIPAQCFHTPLADNGKSVFKKKRTSLQYFLTKYKQDAKLYNQTHGCFEHLFENSISPFNQNWNNTCTHFPGYSYHINAFEFGNSLKKHTAPEKYTEITKTIIDVIYNEQGVEYVLLDDQTKIYADLFIDCSGFKKLLIGKLSKWQSFTDLANNSAVWGSIKGTTNCKPCTQVHAQESGWIWTIPTYDQIGTGYVYSNNFSSASRAEEVIVDFWKKQGLDFVSFKHINFDAGRLDQPSKCNVISNGLAQSFIEPLEATSVMITCVTARVISEIINKHLDVKWNEKMSKIHSNRMCKFIDHIKKFVHFHYKLSERTDTAYWRAVANKPTAEKELSDYIDSLDKTPWAGKGVTFNQYNWTSMMLGFEKSYVNDLPEISKIEMEEYLHYTDLLMNNYKFLTRDNFSIKDALDIIHS